MAVTLHSYRAPVSQVPNGYKHTAPPEQLQVSAIMLMRFTAPLGHVHVGWERCFQDPGTVKLGSWHLASEAVGNSTPLILDKLQLGAKSYMSEEETFQRFISNSQDHRIRRNFANR